MSKNCKIHLDISHMTWYIFIAEIRNYKPGSIRVGPVRASFSYPTILGIAVLSKKIGSRVLRNDNGCQPTVC